MLNMYDEIRSSLHFDKFEFGEMLFVEYTCPIKDDSAGIWTPRDSFIHVLSGKKSWKTLQREWTVTEGNTLYVKKGAAIVTQDFDEDFCMIGFFLPDEIIQESLSAVFENLPVISDEKLTQFTASELQRSDFFDGYFQSMLTYFRAKGQPPDPILKLKIKELLINIIYNCDDQLLLSYLRSLVENNRPSLTHTMESNFCYNLKLEEFAKMCHRSLSKFKRDFFNHYNTTPGKWLLNKRNFS